MVAGLTLWFASPAQAELDQWYCHPPRLIWSPFSDVYWQGDVAVANPAACEEFLKEKIGPWYIPDRIITQCLGDFCHIFYLLPVSAGWQYTVPYAHIQYRSRRTIKLSRTDGSSESSSVITSVEPGKFTALVARVYDQNDQLVPDASLELKLEAAYASGGHDHGDNTVAERTGKLSSTAQGAAVSDNGKTLTGTTGPDGLPFSYKAPNVGGDININARCTDGKNCTPEGPRQVWVGIKDLQRIPNLNSDYRLVGQTDTHPDNHFLNDRAMDKLIQLAANYKLIVVDTTVSPPPVLHLNDASLERGGIFDLGNNWVRPHAEHCMGTVIDIRGNDLAGAIAPENHQIFQKIAAERGIEAMWEIPKDEQGGRRPDLRHFHVRLLGQEGLQCPQ